MENKGKIIQLQRDKVYLVRGIYYFLDKNNFDRLLSEYEECKKMVQSFMLDFILII